jgi:hypothetical protein
MWQEQNNETVNNVHLFALIKQHRERGMNINSICQSASLRAIRTQNPQLEIRYSPKGTAGMD